MSVTEPALSEQHPSEGDRVDLVVEVNGTEVHFHHHHRDGAQIKAHAIAKGVPIEQDFSLSVINQDGTETPVGDDERIRLRRHLEFWAVPGDDNS